MPIAERNQFVVDFLLAGTARDKRLLYDSMESILRKDQRVVLPPPSSVKRSPASTPLIRTATTWK